MIKKFCDLLQRNKQDNVSTDVSRVNELVIASNEVFNHADYLITVATKKGVYDSLCNQIGKNMGDYILPAGNSKVTFSNVAKQYIYQLLEVNTERLCKPPVGNSVDSLVSLGDQDILKNHFENRQLVPGSAHEKPYYHWIQDEMRALCFFTVANVFNVSENSGYETLLDLFHTQATFNVFRQKAGLVEQENYQNE